MYLTTSSPPFPSPSIQTYIYTNRKETNKKQVTPHRPSSQQPHRNYQHNHPPTNPHHPPASLQRRPLSPRPPRHPPQQNHRPTTLGPAVLLHNRSPGLCTPARSPSARVAPDAGCDEAGGSASGVWH